MNEKQLFSNAIDLFIFLIEKQFSKIKLSKLSVFLSFFFSKYY